MRYVTQLGGVDRYTGTQTENGTMPPPSRLDARPCGPGNVVPGFAIKVHRVALLCMLPLLTSNGVAECNEHFVKCAGLTTRQRMLSCPAPCHVLEMSRGRCAEVQDLFTQPPGILGDKNKLRFRIGGHDCCGETYATTPHADVLSYPSSPEDLGSSFPLLFTLQAESYAEVVSRLHTGFWGA